MNERGFQYLLMEVWLNCDARKYTLLVWIELLHVIINPWGIYSLLLKDKSFGKQAPEILFIFMGGKKTLWNCQVTPTGLITDLPLQNLNMSLQNSNMVSAVCVKLRVVHLMIEKMTKDWNQY